MGPHGLKQMHYPLDDDIARKLFRTNRDMPEYVRVALFPNALYMQVTMTDEEDLERTLHTLEIVRHDKERDRRECLPNIAAAHR